MLYKINLIEEINCPGCNWRVTTLVLEAFNKDDLFDKLREGQGVCAICHCTGEEIDGTNPEIIKAVLEFKKYHGIE